jgi:hypothetical protein
MKKRVSILIEEEVIRNAKRLSVKERRLLSEVIQDALVSFLNSEVPDLRKRKKAYQLFCGQPIRLSRKQFKEILREENFRPH